MSFFFSLLFRTATESNTPQVNSCDWEQISAVFRLIWSSGGAAQLRGHVHTGSVHDLNLLVSTVGCAVWLPRLTFPTSHRCSLLILQHTPVRTRAVEAPVATRLYCKDEREPPAPSEIFFFFTFRKVRVAFQERCLHSQDLQRSIWGSEVLASVSVRLPAARGGLHLNSNVAARYEQTLFARLSWLCHMRSVTTS